MNTQKVEFQFITGLKRAIFRNARLRGSWDGSGRYSDNWTEVPMLEEIGIQGCPIFKASVTLDLSDQDKIFKWGVVLDGPQGANFWGIPTEVQDINSTERYRQFRLSGEAQAEAERQREKARAQAKLESLLRLAQAVEQDLPPTGDQDQITQHFWSIVKKMTDDPKTHALMDEEMLRYMMLQLGRPFDFPMLPGQTDSNEPPPTA